MSHTTTIGSVVITDINALTAAINELKREGVKCDLLENARPRAYYDNQAGMGQAPYVVQLSDAQYDIGLYEQQDNPGAYEPRTDFYGGSVERVLGQKGIEGDTPDQTKLGKLTQRYAICAAERQAILQGYVSQRTTKQDGTMQLVLTAA